MLPDFKDPTRPVLSPDPLDVYTEHRMLLEERNRAQNGPQNTVKTNYAPELMRRL